MAVVLLEEADIEKLRQSRRQSVLCRYVGPAGYYGSATGHYCGVFVDILIESDATGVRFQDHGNFPFGNAAEADDECYGVVDIRREGSTVLYRNERLERLWTRPSHPHEGRTLSAFGIEPAKAVP